MPLLYTLIATSLISLVSLSGVLFLVLKRVQLQRWLLSLVGLSAGTMLGAAMFHLLPEAAAELEAELLFGLVTLSFVLFFVIEKVLHWRHCHEENCDEHSFGMMNLIGDSLHNVLDGVVIGASFVASPALGIVATLAVLLHEIPQEIGDFGVLLHAGWPARRALLANFLVAATSMFGGIAGVLLAEQSELFSSYLIPIAAGGFLYIAASDLVPELRKEKTAHGSIRSFLFFVIGLGLMYALTFAEVAH
jgi:zinc and cadmium transporter